MAVLISKTFATTSPESAECGEHEEQGFEFEDVAYTFKELIHELETGGYMQTSCSPCVGSINDWVSTYPGISDYSTGEEIEYSLHYSHSNPARNAKYWFKALRYVGLV